VTFEAVPGTTEFVKRWQPQPGDIVSFKHSGYLLGSKKPKSPVLYRVRNDMSWDDVINNFEKPVRQKSTLVPFSSLLIFSFYLPLPTLLVIRSLQKSSKKSKPQGYWRDVQNWRAFFVEYAKEKSFDPLVPENWAGITSRHIIAHVRYFLFFPCLPKSGNFRAAFL